MMIILFCEADDMSEIIFKCNFINDTANEKLDIRWLTVNDYDIFAEHLELCGQKSCGKSVWKSAYL